MQVMGPPGLFYCVVLYFFFGGGHHPIWFPAKNNFLDFTVEAENDDSIPQRKPVSIYSLKKMRKPAGRKASSSHCSPPTPSPHFPPFPTSFVRLASLCCPSWPQTLPQLTCSSCPSAPTAGTAGTRHTPGLYLASSELSSLDFWDWRWPVILHTSLVTLLSDSKHSHINEGFQKCCSLACESLAAQQNPWK